MNKVLSNPTVLVLGLVSLFADISSEMLYPVTPIFLTSVLGASMSKVGIIEGIAEAIASLLKAYSGLCSDKIQHRKYFVVTGYAFSALAKPITGLASSWGIVLFARGLDRTGKGIRTAPRDALLAEAVPSELRGEAFGWHRMMDTMGAVIGPLFAIWLISSYQEQLQKVFFWALIPGLISIIIASFVRDKVKKRESKSISANWNWKALPSPYKKYVIAWTIFSLGNSSDVFLIMRAKTAGISTTNVILLYCLYNVTYALASPYLGALSDKSGRKRTLSLGFVVFMFVYAGFIVSSSMWEFALLFAVYGLYMAGTDGVGKAFAIDLMPKQKATAVGVLGTLTGLSALIASVAAGYLWDHVSFKATFILALIMSVLGVLALQTVPENTVRVIITGDEK